MELAISKLQVKNHIRVVVMRARAFYNMIRVDR